ncbi:MAG TPA: universal stress protein [Burkholderiales bacterium]|jgi:nucleotide-binding universal stress UspA family protein
MYKHILIPIDDSKLGDVALKNGIALARSIRARVTGFTAVPCYEIPSESSIGNRTAISIAEHNKRSKKKAEKVLRKIAARAQSAGVACEVDYVQSDRPDEAIVRAAEKHRCDLIIMASHGRSGLGALVFGSETRGVLAKSKIPTLVYR